MEHYKLKAGKGELKSTSGNHLCGLLLEDHARQAIPANFQPRRADAIADRDVLLSQIGLLCNSRTDFNDIDLYRNDELFMNAYGLKTVASESVFRRRDVEQRAEFGKEALAIGAFRRAGPFPGVDKTLYALPCPVHPRLHPPRPSRRHLPIVGNFLADFSRDWKHDGYFFQWLETILQPLETAITVQ